MRLCVLTVEVHVHMYKHVHVHSNQACVLLFWFSPHVHVVYKGGIIGHQHVVVAPGGRSPYLRYIGRYGTPNDLRSRELLPTVVWPILMGNLAEMFALECDVQDTVASTVTHESSVAMVNGILMANACTDTHILRRDTTSLSFSHTFSWNLAQMFALGV